MNVLAVDNNLGFNLSKKLVLLTGLGWKAMSYASTSRWLHLKTETMNWFFEKDSSPKKRVLTREAEEEVVGEGVST